MEKCSIKFIIIIIIKIFYYYYYYYHYYYYYSDLLNRVMCPTNAKTFLLPSTLFPNAKVYGTKSVTLTITVP